MIRIPVFLLERFFQKQLGVY